MPSKVSDVYLAVKPKCTNFHFKPRQISFSNHPIIHPLLQLTTHLHNIGQF
jgi:hypothetical protein